MVGSTYRISAVISGSEVVPSSWAVTASGVTLASGRGTAIVFTPVNPVPHSITASVQGEFGIYQSVAQTVNVSLSSSFAEAGVNWEKLVFSDGEDLSAVIEAHDGTGVAPASIAWTLYRNGIQVYAGSGASVKYTCTQNGLYRLKGTAYCQDGTQLLFDSTVIVQGTVTVQHTLPVPDTGGSLIYLGSVYTLSLHGVAGTATSLPYKTASTTCEILLLPGTTHWMFDTDPEASPVDDELVVRTQKGNWCLNGVAGGLSGEFAGYDYGYMPTAIPAPADKRLNITAEVFKVHGTTYNSFTSRVRIKCYRKLAKSVYQYSKCTQSSFPGGEGHRTRRWAALFTNIDLQVDALNSSNLSADPVTYTTVDVTSVPLMTLSTNGTPNPVQSQTGLFYTDSNLYAYYERPGCRDIAAQAVSAIENVRPCCISLLEPGSPPVLNKIKRVHGKLSIFILDGVIYKDSVVTVKIYKSDGYSYTNYVLPIAATRYVDTDSSILNVAEIDIDLSDFQFDETGIIADFSVDESAAETSSIPSTVPVPVVGPDYVYSTVYAHTVSYDGACYTSPTYVSILDDNAVHVTPIGGCQDPTCGPSALYCYTALNAPAENVVLPQPLGMPAPYVSYGSNPARCFYNPIARAFVSGAEVSTQEFFGSQAIELWAYSGTSLCGSSYLYTSCQAKYAPCDAHACSIIVVYPVSSSPHATVEYGGQCYTYGTSTHEYGTRSVVSAASVNPVSDCHDPVCAQFDANGSVVVYNDTQTFLEVPVRFDNLDYGIAHYGVAQERVDDGYSGLTDGFKSVTWLKSTDAFVCVVYGTGTLAFDIGLTGRKRQLIVNRSGTVIAYDIENGSGRAQAQVQPGDRVYLRMTDAYGKLPLQCRGLTTGVRWSVATSLPRLFDTVVVPYTGTTAINAIGFCAYSDDGVYSFYGTLPCTTPMTGPVNPDSHVTVTSGSQEYSLVTARAIGNVRLASLGLPLYAGQTLNGPFTFKFYAAREAFGAHGEMDVWFDTDGTFPGYLRAGAYDSLHLSGTYYRRSTTPYDTTRDSYTVSNTTATVWPNVYTAADGQVISVASSASTVAYAGKVFSRSGSDPGLSFSIIPG